MGEEITAEELKAALLKGDTSQPDTVPVETFAGTVQVRALSRGETLRLNTGRDLGNLDTAAYERKMVALAVVRPTFTEAEVGQWQETDLAGGALADITNKIAEISKLTEGADKSAVPGV